MSPQPLDRANPKGDANLIIAPSAILANPTLGILPMTFIAAWSGIDAQLANILTGFLKADFVAVTAMYQALSRAGRTSALLGAAKRVLNLDQHRLFLAVWSVLRPLQKRRDEFAHALWGTSTLFLDALLLVDPTALMEHAAVSSEQAAKFKEEMESAFREAFGSAGLLPKVPTRKPPPKLDRSRIQVYTRADLVHEVEATDKAARHLNSLQLNLTAANPRIVDATRRQLLAEPRIQQEFESLTRKSGHRAPE